MGTRWSKWTAAAILAATLLLAAPQLAGAAEPPPGGWPRLSPEQATKLMRRTLAFEFATSWKQARGHELDCSTPVHPLRGGAVQQSEIRRRCYFGWRAGGTSYEGTGLVWLAGASADGSRHWTVQYHGVERSGKQARTFAQSGGPPQGS